MGEDEEGGFWVWGGCEFVVVGIVEVGDWGGEGGGGGGSGGVNLGGYMGVVLNVN